MLNVSIPNVPAFVLDYGSDANSFYLSTGGSPNWEPLETQVFIRLLSDNARVLDVGANIGWFSTIAGLLTRASGEIISFEPNDANFSCLSRNIAVNKIFNVTAFKVGVSDSDKEGLLYISLANAGDHRINEVAGREAVSIPLAQIDTVLTQREFMPDLIKMDIQGAELSALRGARRTLVEAASKCAILLEFWPGGMVGGSAEAVELAELLFSLNQVVYVFHHEASGSLRPVDLQTLKGAIHGCIAPGTESYLDILVAPEDDRMRRLAEYIGPPWQPWA